MGNDYRLHRLGAKPSERFPAAVSKVEQHGQGKAELDDNPGESGGDDRDPVVS